MSLAKLRDKPDIRCNSSASLSQACSTVFIKSDPCSSSIFISVLASTAIYVCIYFTYIQLCMDIYICLFTYKLPHAFLSMTIVKHSKQINIYMLRFCRFLCGSRGALFQLDNVIDYEKLWSKDTCVSSSFRLAADALFQWILSTIIECVSLSLIH